MLRRILNFSVIKGQKQIILKINIFPQTRKKLMYA